MDGTQTGGRCCPSVLRLSRFSHVVTANQHCGDRLYQVRRATCAYAFAQSSIRDKYPSIRKKQNRKFRIGPAQVVAVSRSVFRMTVQSHDNKIESGFMVELFGCDVVGACLYFIADAFQHLDSGLPSCIVQVY